MYLYKAFDILIESEIEIPQFISVENQLPDVSIKFGSVESALPSAISDGHVMQVSAREICFYWKLAGWFLVREGREIIVEPSPNVQESLLRIPLIGVVFAALLHQRGMMVLHASAVSVGGGAVAFVGWKGAGKSTTAAMLYKRGRAMISDDIVAMENLEAGAPTVVPGFPIFKLLPETAVSVLADDLSALSRCYSGTEKRFRSFSDNFLQKNLPLKAIFALEEGPRLEARLLKPQEAISTLIANIYLARYGKQLLQNNDAITNLRQCSSIVNHIPIYRLERPKSFELMEDLAELIESHCETQLLSLT